MLTVIVAIIPVMTIAVTDNHHPSTIIGAKNPCVPAVMISVIRTHDPCAPLLIFPVIIPILANERECRTG
jgi:hypothetical protein